MFIDIYSHEYVKIHGYFLSDICISCWQCKQVRGEKNSLFFWLRNSQLKRKCLKQPVPYLGKQSQLANFKWKLWYLLKENNQSQEDSPDQKSWAGRCIHWPWHSFFNCIFFHTYHCNLLIPPTTHSQPTILVGRVLNDLD